MSAGPIEQHVEEWLDELAQPTELPPSPWVRAPERTPKPKKKTTRKERRRR